MDERLAVVRMHRVTKRHPRGEGEIAALRGVDLEVFAGQYLGVFGPSGSGKSTLLEVIAGLAVPDEGSVHVLGQDLRQRSEDERAVLRRRGIGVVYQNFELIASLTLAENVALPLLLDGWSWRRAGERVARMLAAVELSGRSHHRPEQLSGGEMQRAAIARALIGEPRLVLADEPTGNLDSTQGAAVWALLKDLASDRGCAVIVVSHDPRAAAWCDRVIELGDGLIVRSWTTASPGDGVSMNGKGDLWATE